ncbi:hypothetical protein [Heyndrickxia oleronia]|jgi:hypothetical protein|uniref:hypothetical protein n=1 Tax=Heyndrickxia oleronia TaxID=38875 RepID=UPI00039C8AE7|nr:hypothetical protein [Heyndrickxia oleronia]MCI1764019.1 hypothetical protein [Heyndrickxia oleronia]
MTEWDQFHGSIFSLESIIGVLYSSVAIVKALLTEKRRLIKEVLDENTIKEG